MNAQANEVNFYLSLVLNEEDHSIRIVGIGADKGDIEGKAREKASGASYGVFPIDECTRDEILWWLADFGIPRCEALDIIADIAEKMIPYFVKAGLL